LRSSPGRHSMRRPPSAGRSQRRPVGRLLFGLEDRCRRLV
jgi:hypothetical protein